MIILVFGLPGTGKTFFSEHLAKKINAVHLNGFYFNKIQVISDIS